MNRPVYFKPSSCLFVACELCLRTTVPSYHISKHGQRTAACIDCGDAAAISVGAKCQPDWIWAVAEDGELHKGWDRGPWTVR
jgi:hypothetical protein